MGEAVRWEPDWEVSVEEVSAGVYEVTAVSPTLGTVGTTSADPDVALEQVRTWAATRSSDASEN